jgi:hypothetical protein
MASAGTHTVSVKGGDMPMVRGYFNPTASPGDDSSKILVGVDSGANLPVLAAKTWTQYQKVIKANSPKLRMYKLSPGQEMSGFCGQGSPMRAVLHNLCLRIGYCNVVTDAVIMDDCPQPLVLGTSFWWIYDCNLEGRRKQLSMLVPKGEFLLGHCPPDILADRPEFASDPDRVVTRQFLRDDDNTFSFTTRNFKLRGTEVAELVL